MLYYQSEPTGANERAEDENLTPIVLLEGLVVGMGWDYWRDTAAKNGITIQSR